MVIISVMVFGLYCSLPQGKNISWNLIHALYAVGLILAGLIYDKRRFIRGLAAVASLTYPLIASAHYDGINGTVVLSLSYLFRGFLSVYCICAFTDYGANNRCFLPFAPLGLCISKITEVLLSFLPICLSISDPAALIVTAVFFVPLIILFTLYFNKLYSSSNFTEERRLSLFCENLG